MSNDPLTVTTSQSWFSRIGGALAGVLVGLLLFIGAFPLLTWNEGRAIHREKTLQAGSRDVVSISDSALDPANQGKLIHLTGEGTGAADVSDPVFALSVAAIKLRRDVEMYQWVESSKKETRQKLGGGEETVTTYSYEKRWTSELVRSSGFQKPEGHQNPSEFLIPSRVFVANQVRVGAFTLPEGLLDQWNDFQPFPVDASTGIPLKGENPAPRFFDSGIFFGQDPANPAIGDLRVRFAVVHPGKVSILARQVASTFEPYTVQNLGSIFVLRPGTFSAEAMFTLEAQANTALTWILRLVGFVLMFIGLILIFRPLSVFASVIPFLGNLVGMGFGTLAFVIALPLTLATIAIAWIAYRPIIGVPVLILAGVCLFFAARWIPRRKPAVRA